MLPPPQPPRPCSGDPPGHPVTNTWSPALPWQREHTIPVLPRPPPGSVGFPSKANHRPALGLLRPVCPQPLPWKMGRAASKQEDESPALQKVLGIRERGAWELQGQEQLGY